MYDLRTFKLQELGEKLCHSFEQSAVCTWVQQLAVESVATMIVIAI